MNDTDFVAANRNAWNEVAPKHREAGFENWVQKFQTREYSALDATELAALQRLGIEGKKVAHLCCNSGIELISLVRQGASAGVGFDISNEFVAMARELGQVADVNCEFVCTDVYQIDPAYNQTFDLVYLSAGTLGWMPDLSRFFGVVANLLKPGASLFVYESHPVLDMYSTEESDGLVPIYSYFRQAPIVETSGLDYVGKTDYESVAKYWFHHKLSDIFSALLSLGLSITSFTEYDHDISTDFEHFNGLEIQPPMSYILTAQKK